MSSSLLDSVAALEEQRTANSLAELVLPSIRAADLVERVPVEPDWLVPGLLARGWALMVSAREKTGKGTLIAYLLGALEAGRPTIFGPPASEKMTSLVFTEEPEDSIAEKGRDHSLRDSHYVFAWDLPSEIRGLSHKDRKRWAATVQVLVNTAVAGGHKILFVDNISRAAGIEEEGGVELTRAVEIVAEAGKRAGLTVIVDHHHRKSGGDMRDRSRGGTGAGGAVDVALSMDRGKTAADRKRDLVSVGRMKATVWEMTVELDEDGQDYTLIAATEAGERREEGTSAGHARIEAKRLEQLAELNQAAQEKTGEPWVDAASIAAVWGLTASAARRYLVDRVPTALVMASGDGAKKMFASAGWETADIRIKTTKPQF